MDRDTQKHTNVGWETVDIIWFPLSARLFFHVFLDRERVVRKCSTMFTLSRARVSGMCSVRPGASHTVCWDPNLATVLWVWSAQEHYCIVGEPGCPYSEVELPQAGILSLWAWDVAYRLFITLTRNYCLREKPYQSYVACFIYIVFMSAGWYV